MKVYTYSKAREKLSEILEESKREEVVIRRRKGDLFVVAPKDNRQRSPFDIHGVDAGVTLKDILGALRASKERVVRTSRRHR